MPTAVLVLAAVAWLGGFGHSVAVAWQVSPALVSRNDADAPDRKAHPPRAYTDEDLRPIPLEARLRELELLEQVALSEVNRLRRAYGAKPLVLSEDLLEVARAYSRRMAEEKFFAHEDPEGKTVRHRVSEAGIKWTVLGENLAQAHGYVNPVAASLSGWMQSPGHRENILFKGYRQTAIGAWVGDGGIVYFTEIFLR